MGKRVGVFLTFGIFLILSAIAVQAVRLPNIGQDQNAWGYPQ